MAHRIGLLCALGCIGGLSAFCPVQQPKTFCTKLPVIPGRLQQVSSSLVSAAAASSKKLAQTAWNAKTSAFSIVTHTGIPTSPSAGHAVVLGLLSRFDFNPIFSTNRIVKTVLAAFIMQLTVRAFLSKRLSAQRAKVPKWGDIDEASTLHVTATKEKLEHFRDEGIVSSKVRVL